MASVMSASWDSAYSDAYLRKLCNRRHQEKLQLQKQATSRPVLSSFHRVDDMMHQLQRKLGMLIEADIEITESLIHANRCIQEIKENMAVVGEGEQHPEAMEEINDLKDFSAMTSSSPSASWSSSDYPCSPPAVEEEDREKKIFNYLCTGRPARLSESAAVAPKGFFRRQNSAVQASPSSSRPPTDNKSPSNWRRFYSIPNGIGGATSPRRGGPGSPTTSPPVSVRGGESDGDSGLSSLPRHQCQDRGKATRKQAVVIRAVRGRSGMHQQLLQQQNDKAKEVSPVPAVPEQRWRKLFRL